MWRQYGLYMGHNRRNREIKTRGQSRWVASVCFSPNGCLVAAFAQNCVSVWNIKTVQSRIQPECQFHFKRQGSRTASSHHPTCAISPCGNLVAVVDYPHDIWVWDMRTKQSVKHHFQVDSRRLIIGLFFSLDGSLLICVTVCSNRSDRIVILYAWRTSTGIDVSIDSLGGTASPKQLVSSGGAHLIFTDANPDSDYMLIPFVYSDFDSHRAKFVSADGKFLGVGVVGSEVRMYVMGHLHGTSMKYESSDIKSIEFSPNGEYLISASSSNELKIWNIEEFWSMTSRIGFFGHVSDTFKDMGSLAVSWRDLKNHFVSSRWVNCWIRSCDGSLLATRHRPTVVTIWDMHTGEAKFRLDVGKDAHQLQFSESGNVFLVHKKFTIEFWETKTGKKGDILKMDRYESTDAVGSTRVSDDGRKIFHPESVISHDQRNSNLCVWELDGLRNISNLKTSFSRFARVQIAFSPNEELYCLWGKGSGVVEVRIYPSSTLKLINLRVHASWVGFMPDGKDILIISELGGQRKKAIHIWSIEQKKILINYSLAANYDIFYENRVYSWREEENEQQYRKAFISPNGKLLALGRRQPNQLEIYLLELSDPKSTRKLIDLPTKDYPFIQFAPSGTHIITEWGNVPLPGASPPHKLLFATRSWIQEDGEDIMAIPPEHQQSLFGINGHTIAFRDHRSGPWFVVLDESAKSMTP